jgi:hypothetical protein
LPVLTFHPFSITKIVSKEKQISTETTVNFKMCQKLMPKKMQFFEQIIRKIMRETSKVSESEMQMTRVLV